MRAEDVGGDLLAAFSDGWAKHFIRGGIAAVVPLIAKAERERCAKLAEDYVKAIEQISGLPVVGVVEAASLTIAAAIRALPDE